MKNQKGGAASLEGFLRALRGLPRKKGGPERPTPAEGAHPFQTSLPTAEGSAGQHEGRARRNGERGGKKPSDGIDPTQAPNFAEPPRVGERYGMTDAPKMGNGTGAAGPRQENVGRKRGRESHVWGAWRPSPPEPAMRGQQKR
ncbi:hypothetical protein LSM04_007404 [Trypanosoma melophagium]|uniref:uncharacterized protein n=1 Tax=Trypanosoma melophagium TaxID=715481 RepID=UPI00351A9492|nr:hypothetical protein LSM04_007404 [Trypanosoma melophagium]